MLVYPGETLIRKFNGYSNSEVALLSGNKGLFVRKQGNVKRNVERLGSLRCNTNLRKFHFPQIIRTNLGMDFYDMEYIPGLDMRTYLLRHPVNPLIDVIKELLFVFADTSIGLKKFSPIYKKKLEDIDFTGLKFTKKELLKKLPGSVQQSLRYFGDLTLDNIIYDEANQRFVFIDAATIEYDSFVFDLAKLNQDLVFGWFNRNDNVRIDNKLNRIYNEIKKDYGKYFDPYLDILMMLRVLPYARVKSEEDTKFIIERVNKKWVDG